MRWLMRTLIGLAVVIASGTGLVKLNAVAEAK